MPLSALVSHPRARRAIWAATSLVIGAGTVAFTPALRSALVPGLTYQFNMTTSESDESFAAAGKTLMKSVGTVRIAGDKARIDFAEVEGPSPMLSKGGYMLVHEGGNVMYMVDTKEKQYMKIDAKAFGSMFSSLSSMSGGLMKIEVKDASMSVKKLGAGETIAGFATEKWQIAQAYTMSVKTFGMGSASRTESNTTVWMAPQLKNSELMNPMMDMGRNMSAMFQGNKEWDKVVSGPMTELPPVAALKMRSTSKTTPDKGKPQFSISEMEVTNWSKGDVAAAELEVPGNFKMIEMPNMAAIQDSMNAAGGDSAGKKAPSAADAVKSGVRGLLRRKPPAQ